MFANHIVQSSEFCAFAEQGYTHVPVAREVLADLDTPVSTYLKLANQPYSYLLESVQGGDQWGRYSIIGLPCRTIYEFHGNELIQRQDGAIVDQKTVDNPLQTIRELQAQYRVAPLDGLPAMHGGLVGHFGYETIHYIEPRLAQQKPDALGTPDIVLMVSREVVVFDNVSGRLSIITLAETAEKEGLSTAYQRLAEIENQLRLPLHVGKMTAGQPLAEKDYTVHFPQDDFKRAVERCRDYIRDGDIMQVVLSQRVSAPFSQNPFDVYRALRTINPSPYMYYMQMGDYQIVGSSPEILVRLEDQKVTVRPIAGTRKRGANAEEDLHLEQDLLADPKECAEHLMLIDLGRNDIGRIAEIGSVDLTENMIIERYSHVMHIVSNVDGTLKTGLDAMDVLAATFPAGTVSGAPKIRAMEIIAELEPSKRGIYSGAVGYLGWQGNMDTAIAIRTAVIKDDTLYLQAGAGIVADSVPESEWQETLSKARAMFAAVEMATQGLDTLAQEEE